MPIPSIYGRIDRRILVNYRVDPGILAGLLPAPFRPKLVYGHGMAGICLIRLQNLRPAFVPACLGMSSENAAHRVAVEWDDHGTLREGVYVRRRDTSSWFNTLSGGRLFPGVHHHARFTVQENAGHYAIDVRGDDGLCSMSVRGHAATQLPPQSVFESVEEASAFFEAGSLGYSATARPGRFNGLELQCFNWRLEPLAVEEVRSSYFEDESLFPPGSITFDSAWLMHSIDHVWHGKPDLCCNVGESRTTIRNRSLNKVGFS